MYNYNLPERPLEPPKEWDEQIYDFSDCEHPVKKKGWGSSGKSWHEVERNEE